MSFVGFCYFETRPSIQKKDDPAAPCTTFDNVDDFVAAQEEAEAEGVEAETFWTLYGITNDGRAIPIADTDMRDQLLGLMRGILAPMEQAVRVLDAPSAERTSTEELKKRVAEASGFLESFIDNCSNEERI